jgi:hypothetical protein
VLCTLIGDLPVQDVPGPSLQARSFEGEPGDRTGEALALARAVVAVKSAVKVWLGQLVGPLQFRQLLRQLQCAPPEGLFAPGSH